MLLPLKQGLKLQSGRRQENRPLGCYATSIKTRIETFLDPHPLTPP